MSKRTLALLVVVGLIAATGFILHFLPKKYSVREMRSTVFATWKNDELLIFIDSTKMARQENIVEQRLRSMKKGGDWGLVLLLLQGRFVISQETLAEMVGTTRSRVSFFMNRFRKFGFVDYNGNGLQVHSSLLNVVLHD